MFGRKEIWEKLKNYVDTEDLCLFDIDMPSGSKGTLRIFIAKRDKHSAPVSLEECASVSRRISAAPEFDQMLHIFQLEVSSPGINRRLRHSDHFSGAVGERLKLTVSQSSAEGASIVGVLKSFNDGQLELQVEGGPDAYIVDMDKVKNARVDYLF